MTSFIVLALVVAAIVLYGKTTVRKHGGMWFFTCGPVGGSFYIKQKRAKVKPVPVQFTQENLF